MARDGKKDPNAKPASKAKREYNQRPEQKKRRAARNKSRKEAEKAGRVRKGDGKDIDHKDYNPANGSKKNTRVMSASKNRARNKGKGGRPKGS